MYSSKLKGFSHTGLSLLFISGMLAIGLSSCSNNEGLGGSASISGSLTEVFYTSDFSEKIWEQAAVDEEVFILFGDAGDPGDKVFTGPDGSFRFKYLYPGDYTIYYRSDDSTRIPQSGWSEAITLTLGRGEDRELGELIKLNTVDYDDGEASVVGSVKRIKYDNDSYWPNLVVEYVDFAHDHEVYLVYGEKDGYDERVRTSYDGSFAFRGLIPGEYTVFLYSEDVTRVTQHVVLKYELEINSFDEEIDLGEITVEAI